MENKIVAKNSKGEIFEFNGSWCNSEDLIEIISIPDNFNLLYCEDNQLSNLPELPQNLQELSCEYNNIKQLPDLRELKKLTRVWCDIQCFEDYMLDMYNNQFTFYC